MASLSHKTSLLKQDIDEIIAPHKEEGYYGGFTIEVKLHTVEKNLDSSNGLIFTNLYVVRDYLENISDYIELQVSLHLGTFVYDVYNHLQNVEVSIITEKQLQKGKTPFKFSERYKAVYMLEKNTNVPNIATLSKEDLDQGLPIVLTLQLLDRSVETLRIKTTSGNFDNRINAKNKDMSIKAFLKSIISQESKNILIENKPSLDNIHIEEPDNKEPLKSITLNSFTRIIDIPDLIQDKNIGVYNAGLGAYIQTFGLDHYNFKKTFFVYSLYDANKYKKAEYKISFYIPITSSIALSEITYKYDNKLLRCVPYTVNKINSQKETKIMSEGSGFRMSNANSYMKKPVEITEEGPKFTRNRLNTEIVFKERADNLNFAPNESVSSNQFALASKILRNNGSYLILECSNLDFDFIYPGAACKILYEEENKVKELYGVIHKALITLRSDKMSMPFNYNSKTVTVASHTTLQIFCQKD